MYEDERYLHLITELCTGGELFDRIIAKTQSSEGHFSEHDAAKLVRDILDAIRYCHSKGYVHWKGCSIGLKNDEKVLTDCAFITDTMDQSPAGKV